ncbi:MAG: TetR/AcrR family transcriptional regulator [Moraxella sp.]|nr:TetR/AcrR family transcriptional regulator [Moraxella sp.]
MNHLITNYPALQKPKRKNNPEQLRHQLIICAKDIMLKDGIAHLSLQKVADLAGVSKGGLFHHFKNKDELIISVFELFIAQVNTAIMAQVTDGFGAFTKAYINVLCRDNKIGLMSDWAGLIRAMTADNQANDLWLNWLNQKLTAHATTDSDIRLMAVRCAIDGAWLNGVTNDELHKMQAYLLGLIENMAKTE